MTKNSVFSHDMSYMSEAVALFDSVTGGLLDSFSATIDQIFTTFECNAHAAEITEHIVDESLFTALAPLAKVNSDYEKYDLLIGMDQANLRSMYRICGGDFADKMHLLMDFTNRPGEVADPWYTGDFDTTWRDVEEGCRGLLHHIQLQSAIHGGDF